MSVVQLWLALFFERIVLTLDVSETIVSKRSAKIKCNSLFLYNVWCDELKKCTYAVVKQNETHALKHLCLNFYVQVMKIVA